MKMRRVVSTTMGLALVAAAAGPSALCAQAADVDEATTGRVGCFRGRPPPVCKSFWIFEVQAHTPLAQTERQLTYGNAPPVSDRAFESQLEWNLGHMLNLGPSWAVGGVLTVGTGGGDPLTGIKARARRWFGSSVSVALEAGMLRTSAGESLDGSRVGGTADVRLNIRDDGAFFVRWDGIGLPERTLNVSDYHDPGGFQQALSIGAGLGSKPALFGTAAIGVGFAVLLVLLLPTIGN